MIVNYLEGGRVKKVIGVKFLEFSSKKFIMTLPNRKTKDKSIEMLLSVED